MFVILHSGADYEVKQNVYCNIMQSEMGQSVLNKLFSYG